MNILNWLLSLIRPQVDDLIRDFAKLETRLHKVAERHVSKVSLKKDALALLDKAKAEILSEIADTEAEFERAKRIAGRVADLLN